ncbi:MAG: nucleoside phosphorylase [Bacteroidota bacterium]
MQETELILNADGSIYHLNLLPGELASKLILVGDPDRVERVGAFLEEVEFKKHKREFYTITGSYQGERISVLSTGIGTDNIDVVWHEIDALFNIDFESRRVKDDLQSIQVLRLGTCGGMQEEVPVGTLVASAWAVGGDGLMSYYDYPVYDFALQNALDQFWDDLRGALPLYHAPADTQLLKILESEFPQIVQGGTFTAGGFYGPQGRSLGRLSVRLPFLTEEIARFRYGERCFLNMEMEAAAIMALGKALGHRCGTLAVILANRAAGAFAQDPKADEQKLIRTGLEVLRKWN